MLRRYFRPIAVLAALTGLGAYATIMIRGPQGVGAWTEKRSEIRALEETNANLQREIEAKRLRIEKLKNDRGTQELELEKLGLIHQHDTQFRITGQHLTAAPVDGSTSNAKR